VPLGPIDTGPFVSLSRGKLTRPGGSRDELYRTTYGHRKPPREVEGLPHSRASRRWSRRALGLPPQATAARLRDVDRLLICRYQRGVARDNAIRRGARWIQIPAAPRRLLCRATFLLTMYVTLETYFKHLELNADWSDDRPGARTRFDWLCRSRNMA
jgi:hypothetical protein